MSSSFHGADPSRGRTGTPARAHAGDDLADLAPAMPFFRGDILGEQGQPCHSVYLLAQGQVLLSRQGPAGQPYALYLLRPGELFGEGSLRPERRWLVTARALEDGIAHVLPARQLPRLAQHHPELTAGVIALLSGRLEQAHQRLDLLAQPAARERVLGLLEAVGTAPQDGWSSVSLTQAELAGMVGLARETVARVLAELEEDGLIRRLGRRALAVRAAADA